MVAAAGLSTPRTGATVSWDPYATNSASGGSGTWDTGSWWNAPGDVGWTSGNDAVFDGSCGTVAINAGVNADSVTFNTSGYTISGSTLTVTGGMITTNGSASISCPLVLTTGLTKTGPGSLMLSNTANTWSGEADVNGGTLQFQSDCSTNMTGDGPAFVVSNSSTVVIQDNAALTTTGFVKLGGTAYLPGYVVQTGGCLAINGYDYQNSNRALTIGEYPNETSTYTLAGGSLSVLGGITYVAWDGLGVFTIAGGTANLSTISFSHGSAGFATGAGTLTLSGSGNLCVGSGGIVSPSGTSATVNLNGGTLGASASWTSTLPMNVGGAVAIDPAGNSIGLSGALTGSGSLTEINAGTLNLSGSNNYTGGTTIVGGMLAVANSAGSATGSGPLTLNGGVLTAGTAGGTIMGLVQAGSGPHTISPGALSLGYGTLNLVGGLTTNPCTTLAFNINPTQITSGIYGGDLLNLGGSTLTVTGGSITFGVNPPTAVGEYRLFADAGGSPVLTSFVLPTVSGYGYSLTTADSGFIDLDVMVATSGGTWTAAAGGSWSLGSNWSTTPTVPTGGTLTFPELAASSAIGVMLDGPQSAAALVFYGSEGYTLSQGTGGMLTLGTSATAPAISVLNGGHTILAPLEIAGGNLVIAESNNGVLEISGNISDDGNGRSLTLSGDGSGQLLLSDSNSYSGGTTVDGGTLVVLSNTALPNGSSLIVRAGAASLFEPALSGSPLAGDQAPVVTPGLAATAVPEPPAPLLLLAALGAWCGRCLILKKAKTV